MRSALQSTQLIFSVNFAMFLKYRNGGVAAAVLLKFLDR
jgi:hypothetical protein